MCAPSSRTWTRCAASTALTAAAAAATAAANAVAHLCVDGSWARMPRQALLAHPGGLPIVCVGSVFRAFPHLQAGLLELLYVAWAVRGEAEALC
jgi:hypothetical protein